LKRSVPELERVPSSKCMAYSLTLKMEAVCYSEPPVNLYQTTWSHIQEDIILQC
jgi:hypothetical protein